jgi:protein-L-isoaspartate(D-aspartate) O-methyltransferase
VAIGGRLGVVERIGPVGKASLYVRAADGMGRRELFDCFVPVMAGFEQKHSFAL